MGTTFSKAVALLVVLSLVGAGSAQARIDTSFGVDGAVNIEPPVPSGRTENPGAIALSSDGAAYVVSRQSCLPEVCPPGIFGGTFLFRYHSNGQLDSTFASGGSYEIPEEGYGDTRLAVDSWGRPVLADETGEPETEALVVRRLLKSGQPDTTFGVNGAVSLPCDCLTEGTSLITGRRGTIFVAVPGRESYGGVTLYALDAAGHRLRGFGMRGVSSIRLPETEEFNYEATAPRGSMYFGGRSNGVPAFDSWLARISPSGKFDTKFTKTAQKSLFRLMGVGGVSPTVTSAVITHRGKIELFGTAGGVHGFELRLLANGRLDRSFGKKGLRLYPFSVITSATLGSEGAVMAIAHEEVGPSRVIRILGDGKLDPKFGVEGELLPASSAGHYGLALQPGGKGAVTVVDHNDYYCRISCLSKPSLYRFLEN